MRAIDADKLKDKYYYDYSRIDRYCMAKCVIDEKDVYNTPTLPTMQSNRISAYCKNIDEGCGINCSCPCKDFEGKKVIEVEE